MFTDQILNRWKERQKEGTKNPVLSRQAVDLCGVCGTTSIIRWFHVPTSQQHCNNSVYSFLDVNVES